MKRVPKHPATKKCRKCGAVKPLAEYRALAVGKFGRAFICRKCHASRDRWWCMRARCESPKSVSYKNYGARGIRVCDRWKVFENYEADIATLGPAPGPGYSIDRIDNNGDYCLSNVRWASRSVQSVNQRARRDNTSGAVGVYKHAGKWRARITLNTRIYNLGCFTHIEDAKAAYEKAKAARGY